MSYQSYDEMMPYSTLNAKKVKFIPSPDEVPSRNTSKPPSRESVQDSTHKLYSNFETMHQKHGIQTKFFDDMQHFPDQDILEEDVLEEEEYEEGEVSQENDIEFEEEQ